MSVRIGGMLVGYYVRCPRQAWLSLRGLWMEQESEDVFLGRLLHEKSYTRKRKALEIEAPAREGVQLVGKLDWADLRVGVLHEIKKSPSSGEAHVWQLRFYLWVLKRARVTGPGGAPLRGQLDYPALRRTVPVVLAPEHEARLEEIVAAIAALAGQQTPPERFPRRAFCRRCAFEDLCYA